MQALHKNIQATELSNDRMGTDKGVHAYHMASLQSITELNKILRFQR